MIFWYSSSGKLMAVAILIVHNLTERNFKRIQKSTVFFSLFEALH